MLKSVDKNKKACLIHPILQSLYCWVYFHWRCLRLPPPWPPWFLRAEQYKPLRMLGANFPSSGPSKMRLFLALTTRAHLLCTSCFARHVKCTCCVVPVDPGGGGFLSPSHCHLTFLKSFHLPENLNRFPLSIYSLLCSFFFSQLFVLVFLLSHSWCFTQSTHTCCTQTLWQGLCQVPRTQRQSSYLVGRTDLNILFEIWECASHIHKNYFT